MHNVPPSGAFDDQKCYNSSFKWYSGTNKEGRPPILTVLPISVEDIRDMRVQSERAQCKPRHSPEPTLSYVFTVSGCVSQPRDAGRGQHFSQDNMVT